MIIDVQYMRVVNFLKKDINNNNNNNKNSNIFPHTGFSIVRK